MDPVADDPILLKSTHIKKTNYQPIYEKQLAQRFSVL